MPHVFVHCADVRVRVARSNARRRRAGVQAERMLAGKPVNAKSATMNWGPNELAMGAHDSAHQRIEKR